MRSGAPPNARGSRERLSGPLWALVVVWSIAAAALPACGRGDERARVVLRISASTTGAEGEVLSRQIERFARAHPEVHVENQPTPESADERHQLYVQWLNARVGQPDVLQLDAVWTPELAQAGFILPLDWLASEASSFVPAAVSAATYAGRLYAAPWFVDVGMLYYRTDLVAEPPRTFEDLERAARALQRGRRLPYGYVFQAARYEGLLAVFLEVLSGLGGELVDAQGHVTFDSPAGRRALAFLDETIRTGVAPEAVLTWQEEQTRFAFQSGRAAFMRNWPYAIPLLRDPASSAVAGRFSVAPVPGSAGIAGAGTLGGQELAINAHSAHPEAAAALVRYLTAEEQVLERARVAGQLPARVDAYDDPGLEEAFGVSLERLRDIVLHARPRPSTPVYTELSQALQIALHRALTQQTTVEGAMQEGQAAATRVLESSRHPPVARKHVGFYVVAAALLGVVLGVIGLRRIVRARRLTSEIEDARLGLALVSPLVIVVAVVAFLPLGWTAVESLRAVDLRHPDWGRPFIGLANYVEALASPRFRRATLHTTLFVAASVSLELGVGLVMALVLNRTFRGRGLVRTAILLPWAIPTVVAALLWRFAFETDAGPVNQVLEHVGAHPVPWLSSSALAWVPLVAADVWKTSPFVALLLLAGLQGIDGTLYEAARIDGAGAVQQLVHITLPELRPAFFVALVFRGLDAVRAFDLFYVLTGGGPGTATEPVALRAYQVLFQDLRFGLGSALSLLVFALAALFAVSAVRSLARRPMEAP
jgi:ABC-type sugar transport system permease subunit/ABC-type glycerol-3-phosphate transport system substrate-binding protein